jgi:hypothetical protein
MRGAVLLALGLALAAAGAAAADEGRTPRPVIEPAAKGAQCVGDKDFMRRNHMDLLKHQREDTVRKGVRTANFSLKGCIDCHASRQTGSVARASSNFCVSCHSYAAVTIDCFECHSSQTRTNTSALHPIAPASGGALRLAGLVRQLGSEGAPR